jgi:hypothetical protein
MAFARVIVYHIVHNLTLRQLVYVLKSVGSVQLNLTLLSINQVLFLSLFLTYSLELALEEIEVWFIKFVYIFSCLGGILGFFSLLVLLLRFAHGVQKVRILVPLTLLSLEQPFDENGQVCFIDDDIWRYHVLIVVLAR